MSTAVRTPTGSPLVAIGLRALGVVTYLGGLGLLIGSALRAIVRPIGPAPPLLATVARHAAWMLGWGLPLVALLHVGMGSFLAMQAFYGATFLEGVGPVVGVGLFRNVAPLLTGMLLAGLMAARLVPELRGSHLGLDDDPRWVPDREVLRGLRPDPRTAPDPARLAAVRVLAAVLTGPMLVLAGAGVGTLIGVLVAQSFLAIPAPIFFAKMGEMFWVRDVVGVIAKGGMFGLVASLLACHEGLRGSADLPSIRLAALRAACLTGLGVLLINSAYFVVFYYGGPAFGPTFLEPPGR